VKRVKHEQITSSFGDDVASQSESRTGEQLQVSVDVRADRPQLEQVETCQRLILR